LLSDYSFFKEIKALNLEVTMRMTRSLSKLNTVFNTPGSSHNILTAGWFKFLHLSSGYQQPSVCTIKITMLPHFPALLRNSTTACKQAVCGQRSQGELTVLLKPRREKRI
jgi:hypothetical protein